MLDATALGGVADPALLEILRDVREESWATWLPSVLGVSRPDAEDWDFWSLFAVHVLSEGEAEDEGDSCELPTPGWTESKFRGVEFPGAYFK